MIEKMISEGSFIPVMEYAIGYDYGMEGFYDQLKAIKLGYAEEPTNG